MDDNNNICSDDDEDYFEEYLHELVDAAPTVDSLLESLSRYYVYEGLVAGVPKEATNNILCQDEVKQMLSIVDWNDFHTRLLEGMYNNRASNKKNAIDRSKTYTDYKFEQQQKIARNLPPFLINEHPKSQRRVDMWISGVDSLMTEFARLLEGKIVKGDGGDMRERIEGILDSDWQLKDKEHEQTIYYIAGFLLRTIYNKANDKNEKLAHIFKELHGRASIKKDTAVAASLPVERVVKTEQVELKYANLEFFQVVTTIESIFDSMLNEKNVYLYGTLMIADMIHHLGTIDLGFDQFMPSASEDEVTSVVRAVVDSYTNLRGKDFVRKRNARVGASHTETTRAKLGTIDFLNQMKVEKKKKDAAAAAVAATDNKTTDKAKATTTTKKKKKKKGKEKTIEQAAPVQSANTTPNNTNTANNNDTVSQMKVPELKRELKARGLQVGGLKADLQQRLRAAIKAGIKRKDVVEKEASLAIELEDSIIADVEAQYAEDQPMDPDEYEMKD